MPQNSAGLLMYRRHHREVQFFLVHPGGPFYAKKDDGVWTIPKGLADEGEDLLVAARREFQEETGMIAEGGVISLGSIRMKSGKLVHCWLFEGAWNESDGIRSNEFSMEWPPRSGKYMNVPEADRAAWMDLETALKFIHPSQIPFLERALAIIQAASSQ